VPFITPVVCAIYLFLMGFFSFAVGVTSVGFASVGLFLGLGFGASASGVPYFSISISFAHWPIVPFGFGRVPYQRACNLVTSSLFQHLPSASILLYSETRELIT